MDSYLLSDLQQYLQQYPAAHYSHNGKEPLLYVVVLLLSLQFRWVGGPLALCSPAGGAAAAATATTTATAAAAGSSVMCGGTRRFVFHPLLPMPHRTPSPAPHLRAPNPLLQGRGGLSGS